MSLFLSPQPELRNAESSPTAIFEFPTDIQSSFPEDTRNKGWNSSSTAGFSLFGRTGVNGPVSYPAVAEEGNLFESILPFICDEVSNVVMAEKPLPKHSSTSLDLGSIGELQLDSIPNDSITGSPLLCPLSPCVRCYCSPKGLMRGQCSALDSLK